LIFRFPGERLGKKNTGYRMGRNGRLELQPTDGRVNKAICKNNSGFAFRSEQKPTLLV